jgi:hypothetical protein
MKKMQPIASRREFLRKAGTGTVLVVMGGTMAPQIASAGGHLPKVDPNEAQAKALEYTHESSKADQRCNNCQLWQGGDKDWGGCPIFPGKEVNAKGWCKSWVKKTS